MVFSRVAYPVALVVVVVAALILPLRRVRRLTGRWPVGVLRNPSPVERLVNGLLLLLALGCAAWAVAYAWLGAAALGVRSGPPALQWVGWLVVAAGIAIVFTAQMQMGRAWRLGIDAEATPLITAGLFRTVRNPIYSGIILVLGGLLLVSPAWVLLGMIVAIVALLAVQTRREERHLRALHGDAFDRWAAGTGRFVPWLGRIRPPSARPAA